jgi:hypothetical protein
MMRPQHDAQQFAICIKSDDMDVLTPGMIYQVLPDETAVQSHAIRIRTHAEEEYVYPAEYFMLVSFSQEIEQALTQVLQ